MEAAILGVPGEDFMLRKVRWSFSFSKQLDDSGGSGEREKNGWGWVRIALAVASTVAGIAAAINTLM